jgi:hypothetical protein
MTRHTTFFILAACLMTAAASVSAGAQAISPLCTPKVIANEVVVSPKQRYEAGQKAEPPVTDAFDWPDTPMGIIRTAAAPDAPLMVDDHSHVVVMEYEAWWGPKAVTFQGTAAKPLLQSADMQAVGGGYDSADPAIIQQHVAWLEYMGVDAAISEVTNNVSCIFNSEWFAKKYLP